MFGPEMQTNSQEAQMRELPAHSESKTPMSEKEAERTKGHVIKTARSFMAQT